MDKKPIDYRVLKGSELCRVLHINEIYTIYNHTLNKEFTTYGESHGFWEYVYVNKGKLYADTGASIIELNEGEFILHRPNDYHRHFVLNNVANIYIVSFDCDYEGLNEISRRSITVNQTAINIIHDIFMIANRVFERIELSSGFYKRDNENKLHEQLLRNCIENVLITLLNDFKDDVAFFMANSEFDSKNTQLIRDVIEYLKDHVYVSVSVDEICRTFHICKTSLSTKFKEATKRSIIDYFNHFKIIKSMDLLIDGNNSIGDVANQLNYSSSQYYSKMFKKFIGISPRGFLEKYSEETNGIKGAFFR